MSGRSLGQMLADLVPNTWFGSLSMRHGSVSCLGPRGFHRIAYVEWRGPRPRGTVVCVHGLTRNGRDFDRLAAALAAAGWRVVCPDIVGRGRSEWLRDGAGYTYPQYLADVAALLAHLDVAEVDWIGTSMGGLIGMMLAAEPGTPIRRLVMNDVGPLVPRAALQRLSQYVGHDPHFADLAEVETYLRRVHAPFGSLSDADWRHLAEHGHRPLGNGRLGLAYDPTIGDVLRGALADVELWPLWDRLRGPVLVLRGAESDLLEQTTLAEMLRRGPPADSIEFSGVGHAPALMAADQIAAVRDWLGGR